MAKGPYSDLHDHLAALDEQGLLVRVQRPIDKDTELHPLVRWQFRGGIPEHQRKAFLFENVVNARGQRYEIPVAVGALAASRRIYSIGMGCPVEEIGERWRRARAAPIAPVETTEAPCQEVVTTGPLLAQVGYGVDTLPCPISSPGWDSAPFLTGAAVITRDPETGVQNAGNYRAMLKAPNRVGINPSPTVTAGGHVHWLKCRERGMPLPCAIVLGGPPVVAYAAAQKLPYDMDELGVCGGLLGMPLRVVRAKTVDLQVPAEADIVIEGLISTEAVEPEGVFGESHGHLNLKEFKPYMDVTAITRRRRPIFLSIISQVTPSESSLIKKVALEPTLFNHLRNVLGIRSVVGVGMHEPLTNLRKLIVIQMKEPAERDIWQALHAAGCFQPGWGKIIVAVDPDIDAENADAVFWAMCYRMRPHCDVQIIPGKDPGHVPGTAGGTGGATDSAMLVNAILKEAMTPISLPKREYMERAKAIWEDLGLPPLRPEAPWYGYDLGAWTPEREAEAQEAVCGDWLVVGERCRQARVPGGEPHRDV